MAKAKKPVEEVEVKPKKKSKNKETAFDPLSLLNEDLDSIAKKLNVNEGGTDQGTPMSTGWLVLDMIHGGGIRPAWYTNFGGEQSCKTTTALTIMAAAIKAGIACFFKDYEGSTKNSLDYVQSILKTCGLKKTVDEVFGKKDPNTGKWVTPPIVRYSEETVGEKFFDYVHALLKSLPDKRMIGKKWWYVYDSTKENISRLSEHADNSMPKKYGKGIYIEAENGDLQALVMVDSYPAMNPAANDDEESNNSLALQARMFSKHIPRIKGRLGAKRVAIIGINQLRAIPMAMYGPKEQEPGGVALKFNSDARTKHTSRAISGAPLWAKGEGSNEFEKSYDVDGGTDKYRYIHLKTEKNKLWNPKREVWMRLWEEDGNGQARGFDPFFDTMYYLKLTGQLKGKGRKMLTLDIHDFGKTKKTVPWGDLKAWVLGDKDTMRKLSKQYGFKDPINLRSFCFKQIRSGVAEFLYAAEKKKSSKESDD